LWWFSGSLNFSGKIFESRIRGVMQHADYTPQWNSSVLTRRLPSLTHYGQDSAWTYNNGRSSHTSLLEVWLLKALAQIA
jgi:hypothetical protein